MSMRHYPSSGYVVPLEQLVNIFVPAKAQEYCKELLEEGDTDEMYSFLAKYLPKNMPAFDLYRPSDEDIVEDDMLQNEWYVIFQDSDLYELIPKEILKSLHTLGIIPVFSNWAVLG